MLETLVALGWVGQLSDARGGTELRSVLLVQADTTLLEPLIRQLLLAQAPSLENLWEKSGLRTLYVRDAL